MGQSRLLQLFAFFVVIALTAQPVSATEAEKITATPLAPVESTETFDPPAEEVSPPAATPAPSAAPAAKKEEPAPVKAATEEPKAPAKVEHSRILPVKINPIQKGADQVSKAAPDIEQGENNIDPDTLALLSTQGDGGLGASLWSGMSRTDIVNGINKVRAPSFSPTQYNLLLRILLTKADIEPSKATPPTPDIFTARISKLIEMGAFAEAVKLNERLDSPVETQAGAIAGMASYLANGQVAIACLEQKALGDSIKTDDAFWAHLEKFCNTYINAESGGLEDPQGFMKASVAFTKAEQIAPPAQFEDLNKRTLVELMAMAKSGTLERGKWSVATASKLNPSVVAFLLAMQPQSVNQKLSLLTVAVAHGIKTPDDLSAAYKEIASSPAGPSAPRGDWGVFTSGSAKFTAASTVKETLKSAANFSPAAYTPYAVELAGVTPAAPLTPQDAQFILRVFIAAQEPLPLGWVNYAYGTDFTEESGESALLKIWNQGSAEGKKGEDKSPAQVKPPKGPITPELAYALILQDFFNDREAAGAGRKSSYDNFLSLTGSNNYVMPSDELTESLKKAAQARHLGKTLLYGLQILDGRKADEIHPSVLRQVLKAFDTAGLSEETVSLAREALAGLTKEKKEN